MSHTIVGIDLGSDSIKAAAIRIDKRKNIEILGLSDMPSRGIDCGNITDLDTASNDLRKATQLAKRIVTEYGMDETLGPRTFGERDEMIFLGKEIHEQRDYSEKTAELIDQQVTKLITDAQKVAQEILTKDKKHLLKIVKLLLKKETIEREEFEALFEKN